MYNKDMNTGIVYIYTCPKPLGYFTITLDQQEKVLTCIFVDKKSVTKSVLPQDITIALDAFFMQKKNLPKTLISKHVTGSDFQKSIWEVIKKVPLGKTISYTDIAEKVGNKNAVRAAGTACGRNPLALFIPCHRVVRKTGEDYGYSWGADRKKWLLAFEREGKIV